jgi:predicted 3-demethylubiquinone-9 3-methyltransferase (glyoxalase superfamily)/uncharacterized protein YndB with AHSA1/START domain
MAKLQKITPFLWFENQAEEAASFYVSVFKNSKIERISRQNGKVLVVDFTIEGQNFQAINGGPMFKITEAVSFVVHCKNQKEVDCYWHQLTADGGEESMCSWLKDKFGVSWQIVPTALPKLLSDPNPEISSRAMANMLQMKKIVIRNLTRVPKKVLITIKTTVKVPVEKAWEAFTSPKHVMQWNQASPDWHCPAAKNDLRAGGSFSYTMAAKDGSFSFDFEGKYDEIEPLKLIKVTLADERYWLTTFKAKGKNTTEVTEIFEAEQMNPVEMQRGGWQAILNSFKAHTEQV